MLVVDYQGVVGGGHSAVACEYAGVGIDRAEMGPVVNQVQKVEEGRFEIGVVHFEIEAAHSGIEADHSDIGAGHFERQGGHPGMAEARSGIVEAHSGMEVKSLDHQADPEIAEAAQRVSYASQVVRSLAVVAGTAIVEVVQKVTVVAETAVLAGRKISGTMSRLNY